jgi:hypothetical protein
LSNSQISEGVFEALFRQAVIDNFNEEFDSLPSDEELAEQYTFSQEHENRMKKLFAREERKERLQATVKWTRRIAAAVMITATLLFGSLMFVPQVRAVVFQTLTEWYEKFVKFTSNAPEAEKTNLEPGYISEGFAEIAREEIPMMATIIYINADTGETITFNSSLASGSTSADSEGRGYTVIAVDGIEYHILRSEDGVSEHSVVWEKADQRYAVTSTIPSEELLKMAISVNK